MKKRFLRTISCILILAMAFSLVTFSSYGAYYGSELHNSSLEAGQGTVLNQGYFWSSVKDARQTEHYIEYEPNAGIYPITTYGNTVYGTYKLSTVVTKAQEAGYRVVAAINGDFYNTANGIPTGMVITDGILRCSENSKWSSVGFYEDGTAIIGRADLNIRADALSLGTGISRISLNRATTATSGVVLYTPDFNTTNKVTIPTVNLVLTVMEGAPAINGTMTAYVDSIVEAEGELPLSEGQVLLTMAKDTAYTTTLGQLQSVIPGDLVTFTFPGNEAWTNVKYAVGGGDTLVTAGRNVAPEGTTYAPRSALGVKADGSVILYTIDGRKSGYSAGASEYVVAERMMELGCFSAINLDGGGSTAMHLIYPGDESLSTVNVPSEGSLRSVSNYILLVSKEEATGDLERLHVYPYDVRMLSGATQSFTVKATDAAWHPVALRSQPQYDVSHRELGQIDSAGVFTAGPREGTGSIEVAAEYRNYGAEGRASVLVVSSPSTITLKNEDTGKAVTRSAITVEGETVMRLSAEAAYNRLPLVAQDRCFTWSVDDVTKGTIDEEGTFTAGDKSGSCVITVAAGETAITLTVNIVGSDFFLDMDNHWAKDYVNSLYIDGIVAGIQTNEGLVYRPDNNMTRAEFSAMVSRWLGADLAAYSETELPFADLTAVPEWALPSVKAVYALGIVKGSSTNGVLTFNPNSTITREEAMTILGRTMTVDETAPELTFGDSETVSGWALAYVKDLVNRGIISGSNNLLHPKDPVTRGQVAKIIFGLQELTAPTKTAE